VAGAHKTYIMLGHRRGCDTARAKLAARPNPPGFKNGNAPQAQRGQHQENSQRGADAFPALIQPHGKAVADQRGDAAAALRRTLSVKRPATRRRPLLCALERRVRFPRRDRRPATLVAPNIAAARLPDHCTTVCQNQAKRTTEENQRARRKRVRVIKRHAALGSLLNGNVCT